MVEAASTRWPHTGAVLVGGQSRRMGTAKAGLLRPDGLTLAEHAVRVLQQVCRTVVLVGDGPGIPDTLAAVKRIPDRTPDQGPLGGIEALLASGVDEEYLVVPCDLPRLRASLLRLLIDAPHTPVCLLHRGRREPLLARYPARVQNLLGQALRRGQRSMQSLLTVMNAAAVSVPPELSPQLTNVNTPLEWQQARDELTPAG